MQCELKGIGKALILLAAILLLAGPVSASYPSAGTCEILENQLQAPASCSGNILTVEESAESFDVLEAPEGIDIDSFALHQRVFNDSYRDENKFFVRFYTASGTYKFLVNNKEIAVNFQEPQGKYSSLDWLMIVLLAVLLAVLSLGIIFLGNKKQKLLMAIGWGIVLILLLMLANPL